MPKQYTLVISDDDKKNLIAIVKNSMFKGEDSAYVVGLMSRIEGAAPVEEKTDGAEQKR
jgi:hypothetical protein